MCRIIQNYQKLVAFVLVYCSALLFFVEGKNKNQKLERSVERVIRRSSASIDQPAEFGELPEGYRCTYQIARS